MTVLSSGGVTYADVIGTKEFIAVSTGAAAVHISGSLDTRCPVSGSCANGPETFLKYWLGLQEPPTPPHGPTS